MDPLTIAALAQGLTGATQAIMGFADRKRAKDRLYGEKGEDGTRSGGLLDQKLPMLQTPEMYNKMYKAAQNSKAFQSEKQAADQRFSNIVNSLGSGRERMAATTGAARQNFSDVANAAARQQQQEIQAGTNLANAQFQTNQFNTQAGINKQMFDLQTALGGYQAGTETGLSGLGQGLEGFGVAAGNEFGQGSLDDMFAFLGRTPQTKQQPIQGTQEPNQGTQEEGGSVRLDGEFNHESNPKYVYNDRGEVEAEMTGDETLVFNPEQREFLKMIMMKLMRNGEITQGDVDPEEARDVLHAFMK